MLHLKNQLWDIVDILVIFRRKYGVVLDDVLFPDIEINFEGDLQVSDLHTIHWEESGNVHGHPVIVLHGGPGGGVSLFIVDILIQRNIRIIQFDQRGCGKSKPHAELVDNNTWLVFQI